jgi:hypothetical protein
LVPDARSLLQTIQGLVETTHVIQISSINKTRRLLTIDNFIKHVVEKGIFDVKMTNMPIIGDGNTEDEADRFRLGNRTGSLVIVDARTLRVAAYYPTSFVTSKSAVRVELWR